MKPAAVSWSAAAAPASNTVEGQVLGAGGTSQLSNDDSDLTIEYLDSSRATPTVCGRYSAAGGVFAPTITKVHRAVLQRYATCRDPVSHLLSMCQFLELVFEEIGRFLSQTSPTFWMDQAEYGCEASKVQIFANRADRCGRKEGGRNG